MVSLLFINDSLFTRTDTSNMLNCAVGRVYISTYIDLAIGSLFLSFLIWISILCHCSLFKPKENQEDSDKEMTEEK